MARAGRWLFALTLAGAVLAVGTVHTVTLCIVTGALAIAAFLTWWEAEPMRARPVATLLLCTGAALTAYTALQVVPLPASWLAAIAPHNADVWSRALAPLHQSGPSWVPLSLDPVATRTEVLKGVAYLLAFLTALRIARRREGVTFLGSVIVLTGVTVATAALLHPAFGAHKVFGLYQPHEGIVERHIAPLLNPNHLAAYINLTFCLTLAASLSSTPPVPRAIAIVLVVLLAATQVWVASRAGVVAMVLAGALVLWMAYTERGGQGASFLLTSIFAGIIVVLGAALIVLGTVDDASTELLDADLSKLALFRRAMRMSLAYPIFGVGRGAFESTYPAFREGQAYATFTHPENVVAQWVIEWGLAPAMAGFGAIAVALRPSAALARSRIAIGAWVALIAVAVHNLGDFNSEIPGIVLGLATCAAIVAAGTSGTEARKRFERWARRPRLVAGGALLLGAGGLALTLPELGLDLSADRRHLYDLTAQGHVSLVDYHADAATAMVRHPAEPYLPFISAQRAERSRDESPMPWLEATLERAPVYGPAHLVLARLLARRSPAQARFEYRVAIEQAPELQTVVAQEALGIVGDYDAAMELVPPGSGGIAMLESLIGAVADRLPATQRRLDDELAARAPDVPWPVQRAATAAVEDLDARESSPWCSGAQREACIADALKRAKIVIQREPKRCAGFELHARAIVLAGETKRGLDELEQAADAVDDRVVCLMALGEVASRVGDGARVDIAFDKIVRSGCRETRECVDNLAFVAQRQEGRGYAHIALTMYKRAFELAPQEDSLLVQMARLASQEGLHAEALEDYQSLIKRQPEQQGWRDAAVREKDAVLRGIVTL